MEELKSQLDAQWARRDSNSNKRKVLGYLSSLPSSSPAIHSPSLYEVQIEEALDFLASQEDGEASSFTQLEIGAQLHMTKLAYGCSWASNHCFRGDHCSFTHHYLGLNRSSDAGMKKVTVLQQTPQGLVKMQECYRPLDQEELQQMNPKNQDARSLPMPMFPPRDESVTENVSSAFWVPSTMQPHLGVPIKSFNFPENPVTYRPPLNSVLIKIPLNQANVELLPLKKPRLQLTCDDCDFSFTCQKTLTNHIRNMHTMYRCTKCAQETIGYYKMVSHMKREHSNVEVFPCPCGRNFSQRKGLMKHQNSCAYGI